MNSKNSDSPYTLFRSAKHFFSGTLLSRISGMGRDIAMTFAFGTSPAVAAFLLAFRFAHLCRRLFGEGALHTAFIPLFEDSRARSTPEAYTFFLHLKGGLSLFLLVLLFAIMGSLGMILTFGSLSPANREIIWLTLLMMPSLFFICLFGLNSAFLNCEKHFFIPGIAPVTFNLISIVSALLLRNYLPEQAMVWLSFTVILGCACQWLITIPPIYALFERGPFCFSWKLLLPNFAVLKRLGKPLLFGMLGVAASQINNTIDVLFARYAHEEGPAYLWYAIRLQQLPLALFGISLSGALLPPLTRAIKENQPHLFFQLLRFSLEKALVLMIPLSFALLLLATCSINFIYGRGQFSNHSTYQTTLCLWGYGLGLLPMALVLILAAVFYAQKNYRIPLIASMLALGLNGFLNTILVGVWNGGAASVALATSVSAWVNLFYLLFALPKRAFSESLFPLLRPLGKITLSAFLAFSGAWVITHFLIGDTSLQALLTQTPPHFSREFSRQCFYFFSETLVFFLLLGMASWACRVHEVKSFFKAPPVSLSINSS
ncbi:murein biosynthesis integral membrane protein MurJ [Parachlamydia sp. AcF125]|uniref:murein biosynthesis integral membrane protein MurJ n=1 Tax=Parachlamydia sp. AcF125 TaxID=2795736 RepID=UPI001BC9A98E|nr:murein biosynthesis integral membrane protein MurJ [Parachlamydia sp. AcF125]